MDEPQPPAAPTAPSGAGEAARPDGRKSSRWKRLPAIVAGSLALAVLFYLGLHYLTTSLTHESTDNAFLDGNIVAIAPRVSGQIKKVFVSDNQTVKAGDVMAEIDPRDYEIQLAQKKSALTSAEANVNLVKASFELLAAQVGTAEATAKQSEAEAAADRAKADRANADLKRAEDLNQRKIISPQEFDAAKSAAEAAEATWNASREKALSDRSKVTAAKAQLEAGRKAWDRAIAQSDESQVDVQQADLNLSYTRLTAPQDGRVTRKAVEAGDYVQVGQKLMALVLNDLWVTANFKETQLKNIRTNQPVRISIDSIAGKTFSGRVQSIQSGSGAAFSLLPPENAVGNYVKIVQRVPVKIVFDSAPQTDHVLGPGMSAVPAVRVRNFEIPEAVTVVAAILLAGIAGLLWKKLADRPEPAA
jgi:membrane fusion protein (multidrug efflux system)